MSMKEIILKKIKDRDWSIPRAAKESGLPLPTLKQIIYGKGRANVTTLEKLSTALECGIGELIAESSTKNPSNDVEILKKCLLALDNYTQKHNISLSKEDSMSVMDSLYSLTLKKQTNGKSYGIDEETIGWIIDNI